MINILVLCSDFDGVGKFRQLDPHLTMNDPEIHIEIRFLIDGTLNLLNENYISNFNMIFYNKTLPFSKQEYLETFLNIVKRYNIKLVYDIDDYFILTNTHLNYKQWKESNAQEITEKNLRMVDGVITTTPIYKNKLLEYNKNVFVVENGVNSKEQQFISKKRYLNDKVKFIWSGGISHRSDLSLLTRSFTEFSKDFMSKSQIFMAGFDLRMRTQFGTVKSDPRKNEWTFFEDIFTNKGKWLDNKNREFLNKYDDNDFGWNEDLKDSFYNRIWTKPITIYGENVGQFNNMVSLAPLKSNNTFNLYKSQLKLIECGIHRVPIIASNYGPYTIDNIEKNEFGFLIDENNSMGWYEKMKYFVDNPHEINRMGNLLYEYIMDNYEIDVLNKKRAEIYKKIVNG